MAFYNIYTLYISHLRICFTTVGKNTVPASFATISCELLFGHFTAHHKASISSIVSTFTTFNLLHHLRPELGAGHTPQLALGQHVEDGLRGILFRLGGGLILFQSNLFISFLLQ